MHDSVAWSYALLGAGEQRLFRRAAVLVGSWTPEAAAAICNCDGAGGRGSAAGLGALAEQSMLVREDWGGEVRFKMLEPLREFALAQLAAAEEEEATRRAHAAYYTALALAARTAESTQEPDAWLAALSRETDNLRAALRWGLATEERGPLGLRLAASLARYWAASGSFAEGRHWLEQALTVAVRAPADQRAAAHHGAATLAYQGGDWPGAASHYEAALALWQQLAGL